MNIKISSESAYAEISTSGAELMSFCMADGTEYLWQGSSDYWTGRAPVLFPCVGGLRDGKTVIDGKVYEMKRHGFAKFSEFIFEKTAENSVIFTLSSNSETLALYPFEFQLNVIFTLYDKILKTEYKVTNKGDGLMPFAVGGHPAFNCPVPGENSFEECEIRFNEKETIGCHKVNMQTGLIHFGEIEPLLSNQDSFKLTHSLFYQDALVFSSLKSTSVKLIGKNSGHGVKMDFGKFPMIGIWSAVNDAPFIALEPWTGCATCTDESDDFRKKRGMKELAKNEVFSAVYETTIF